MLTGSTGKLQKYIRKNAVLMALLVMVSGILILYASLFAHLFIFGDATMQADIARNIWQEGLTNTYSSYPPLYHVFGAILFSTWGENGFKFITLIGLLLLGFSSFLLARRITGSAWIGLASAFLVLCSTKTSFYGARMYMEIFVSAFVLITVLYLLRYLKNSGKISLVLSAFFCGITISIKQQGLFILFPSIVIFLLSDVIIRKFKGSKSYKKDVKNLAIFVLVVLSIVGGPIYWQFRQTGSIVPDTRYTSWVNEAGRRIANFKEKPFPLWRQKWDQKLDDSFRSYAKRGFSRAEARHIWSWDVIISPTKSFSFHNLFWFRIAGESYSFLLIFTILVLFSSGIILWIQKERENRINLFLVIFLILNYVAFLRTTHQSRYQLYVSYILAFLCPYATYRIIGIFKKGKNKSIMVGFFTFVLVVSVLTVLARDTTAWKKFTEVQAYSGSAGGMHSVIEVSQWIKNQSQPTELMYAIPGNEFRYYSRRRFIFDYRAYFLLQEELAQLFEDMRVKYIVIMNSSVVPDHRWISVTWAPESFVAKIKNLYSIAYESSYKDITVYEAEESENTNSQ